MNGQIKCNISHLIQYSHKINSFVRKLILRFVCVGGMSYDRREKVVAKALLNS